MSSKSSAITLAFVLVSTILVVAYALQLNQLSALFASTNIPTDVAVSAVLGVLAFIAIKMGAEIPIVAIISTLGMFITLTLQQTEPIRYMTLAAVLFCIGFYGLVVSRNAVRVLIAIELMLNAANINMVTLSRYVDPVAVRGQVFAVFILTVAAAEAAVGLAIVLAIYRNMATVDMESFNQLKG